MLAVHDLYIMQINYTTHMYNNLWHTDVKYTLLILFMQICIHFFLSLDRLFLSQEGMHGSNLHQI